MTDIRRLYRWIGAVITAVSAMFTFAFGFSMATSVVMAFLVATALACATIASAYVWPFVADSFNRGCYVSAGLIVAFGILVTGTDVTTNFGSISWQRGVNIQRADTQNVVYSDKRAQVNDDGKTLKMWLERRKALLAKKPWVATVSADGLRADLKAAQEAARQESNRGGCGPKCLKLMKVAAGIAERVASAEALTNIDTQITATERLIAKARTASAIVKKAESPALLQNTSLASFFTLNRTPTDAAMHWTDKGVNWLVATFLALGAIGANYIGWWGMGTGSRLGAPPAAPKAPRPQPSDAGQQLIDKINAKPAQPQAPVVHVHNEAGDMAGLLRAIEKKIREGGLPIAA